MIRFFIFTNILCSNLFGAWLTLEEAINNTPFSLASLGWNITFPNEDAVLIRGEGDNWKRWYKVNLIYGDTTLFLDSMAFNFKGDDLYVSGITFSNNSDKMLVRTKSKKIWRHSHSSTYFIYDIKNEKLNPLSDDNTDLRNVKFSPDGQYVAYLKNDNNLYVYNITRNRQRQLTTTGSENILNGHFGWLYEEELTGYDGYRWSPDSESIAYWEENQSMVPEFIMINDLLQYPEIKKIRYPKAGEQNPSLRIGIARVKGAGRRWITEAEVDNDYLPWMEWVNEDKISFLKMKRDQKSWNLFISDHSRGKSMAVISEKDESGWLDNDGQIKFLDNGKIIWLSEKSGYKHIWMSKHSGSSFWPITEGSWEVFEIIHIDEINGVIYFIANKESVFEKKLYSIRFDGTELDLLTPELGSHSIQLTGSKKYFIDRFSSLNTPTKILLKELETGEVVRLLA